MSLLAQVWHTDELEHHDLRFEVILLEGVRLPEQILVSLDDHASLESLEQVHGLLVHPHDTTKVDLVFFFVNGAKWFHVDCTLLNLLCVVS